MRSDVRRDLSWSADAFTRQVWPVIAEWCGGGELWPVETTNDEPGFKKRLDTDAGIDGWQIKDGEGIRGVASRVQAFNPAWREWPFNTFTIREKRDSGAETEYAKRSRALLQAESGWLFPGLTVQAYLSAQSGGVLQSVAVVRTRDLIEFLMKGWPEHHFTSQRTTNASFYCVDWIDLARFGREVIGRDVQLFTYVDTAALGAHKTPLKTSDSRPPGFFARTGGVYVGRGPA